MKHIAFCSSIVFAILLPACLAAQHLPSRAFPTLDSKSDTSAFVDVDLGIPTYAGTPAGAWVDYDSDGDLDIFIAADYQIDLYSNEGNNEFDDINVNITLHEDNNGFWGDYDNDGDPDVIIANGWCDELWKNEENPSFVNTGIYFTYFSYGRCAWGDYDNDGDLDVLATGFLYDEVKFGIYKNRGNESFIVLNTPLPRLYAQALAWVDYDNDGDLDFIVSGAVDEPYELITAIYRNDSDLLFTRIENNLPSTTSAKVAWGDYDSDGDLDLLLAGRAPDTFMRIYENMGDDIFEDIEAGLEGIWKGNFSWGDYDNDGDLDILAVNSSSDFVRIYRNDGLDSFTDAEESLPMDQPTSGYWGDYDSDGDLDILLMGNDYSTIFKNTTDSINLPPSTPANLRTLVLGDSVRLEWDAATDDHTPAAGLHYNVRVGTTRYGHEIVSAQAEGISGFRRLVELGNAQMLTRRKLADVSDGIYYWSVQSIDNAFAASAFAVVDSFVVGTTTNLDAAAGLPERFSLSQNYPNPFNGTTLIDYVLPASRRVSLSIYNVSGEVVRRLINAQARPSGTHQIEWDGRNDNAEAVGSGVYFYQLIPEGAAAITRKMMLVK